jgi:hypothetical protein
VKPADLLELLRDFYRDKLALALRHQAGARPIAGYEVNNTYQYILCREDAQLTWLRDAIVAEGGVVPEPAAVPPVPAGDKRDGGLAVIAADDARLAQAFIDRWASRVDTVTHARHRRILKVILGEAVEQVRFFQQAAAGRRDLLGRRADGAGTGGGVMPARWVE